MTDVFHFVTEGIKVALDQARDAAHGKDVRIGGGAAVIRQYLQAPPRWTNCCARASFIP